MPWTKPCHPPRNERLDADLYSQSNRVVFITVRAFGDHSPFVSPQLSTRVLDILRSEQTRLSCHVHTYCLMPDHPHYLISPAEDGVSVLAFTRQFKGKATNESWKAGWRGKLWQPRCYDHIVRHDESLVQIAQYILDNPVRKNLVEQCDDWPWSGHMNPLPIW
jgi:putative transposase